MEAQAKIFDEIVNERRSVRKFDEAHNFDHEAVTRSIERAILSPNSSNMQLWEFYRIKSKAAKEQLSAICLGQNAAKSASELVVFVNRPDKWQHRQQHLVNNLKQILPDRNDKKAKLSYQYYEKWIPNLYNRSFPMFRDLAKRFLIWKNRDKPFMQDIFFNDLEIITQRSTALAAQTFMLSIKAEGYDSCPMEGHDSKMLKSFLKLPKAASINMVIGVGKGIPAGIYGERFRIPNEEVIFEL